MFASKCWRSPFPCLAGSIDLIGITVLGLAGPLTSAVTIAADPVVGWQEVQAAVDGGVSDSGSNGAAAYAAAASAIERNVGVRPASDWAGTALPPPPRSVSAMSVGGVQPASLAGTSSSVVPAVTGDLYWVRPSLDMRVIGQSLGHNSSLRLSRPVVGVSVGTTTVKPAVVGVK